MATGANMPVRHKRSEPIPVRIIGIERPEVQAWLRERWSRVVADLAVAELRRQREEQGKKGEANAD